MTWRGKAVARQTTSPGPHGHIIVASLIPGPGWVGVGDPAPGIASASQSAGMPRTPPPPLPAMPPERAHGRASSSPDSADDDEAPKAAASLFNRCRRGRALVPRRSSASPIWWSSWSERWRSLPQPVGSWCQMRLARPLTIADGTASCPKLSAPPPRASGRTGA